MKHKREYEIAWQGLRKGVSEYEFEIDNEFMLAHGADEEEYKDWEAMVKLKFDKHESFFMLHFDVSGKVGVACDRCGDDFVLQLWDEFDLLVKLEGEHEGEKETEDEADVAYIPRSETVLDIAPWLYEFVLLSVPLQKVHPDKSEGVAGCNPEALKLLSDLSETEEAPEHNIWKGLEALKEENTEHTKQRKTK